jgi:hypothetical protein
VGRQAIHFFAAKDDLSTVLDAVEARCDVSYVECGLFDAPDRQPFSSFRFLPTESPERRFLLLLKGAVCDVRKVAQRRGGFKFAVDQMANPGTAVLRLGFELNESQLIAGEVGTIHDDENASFLVRVFSAEVERRFKRIKAFWVGPEAMARLEGGARLTTNINSPKEYDLRAR